MITKNTTPEDKGYMIQIPAPDLHSIYYMQRSLIRVLELASFAIQDGHQVSDEEISWTLKILQETLIHPDDIKWVSNPDIESKVNGKVRHKEVID